MRCLQSSFAKATEDKKELRSCLYCVHCEMVHGLAEVVLICAHRPGFRGLWVAVGRGDSCPRFKLRVPSSSFAKVTEDKALGTGVRAVPLSQGKFALVDAGDYAAVMAYSWYAASSYAKATEDRAGERRSGEQGIGETGISNATSCDSGRMPELPFTWYAVRKDGGRTIRMHREIMGAVSGEVVDHVNHDGLDNRRSNLRVCSHAENVRNQRGQRGRSSRYKGVSRDKRGKWRAQIWYNGRHFYLGLFGSEAAAARAYNAKARELFGEFAYLNKCLKGT